MKPTLQNSVIKCCFQRNSLCLVLGISKRPTLRTSLQCIACSLQVGPGEGKLTSPNFSSVTLVTCFCTVNPLLGLVLIVLQSRFWGERIWSMGGLSPQRDCGTKSNTISVPFCPEL